MDVLIGVAVGMVAGFAGAVAGIGGGVIMVPSMVFLLGLSQTTAQGTSLMAMLFTTVAGTWVNVRNGRVDLKQAAWIGLGGMVAAQFGKTAALAIDPELLQRLFGAFVLVMGVRMGRRGWKGLRAKRTAAVEVTDR